MSENNATRLHSSAIYFVRCKGTKSFISAPDGYRSAPFAEAYHFLSYEHARRVADRTPEWREVVEVSWWVKWSPIPNSNGKARPHVVRTMKVRRAKAVSA